jgi:TRAP transporter TAXI family solute receptor
MNKLSKIIAVAALVLGGGFFLNSAIAQQQTIAIGTGGTGGVYYPIGGGMANIISKYLGIQATAEVTGGSVDNIKLVNAGKDQIALSMADAALDALKGEGKFKSGKVALRTLMVLYPNRMHVVTTEATGITKMSDLKGKRVSTGSPGSATEVMAFRLIEAAGLDKDKDMKRERLGASESANAMKDGKIDAYFWVGGIPTSSVTDLAATQGIKIKLVDHAQYVDAMNKKYGNLYSADTIKAGSYPGQKTDNKNIDVWNILIASDKMSDDMAYKIVKLIFDKKPELVAVHRQASAFEMANQKQSNSSIPFHPGAIKYFKEKGLSF